MLTRPVPCGGRAKTKISIISLVTGIPAPVFADATGKACLQSTYRPQPGGNFLLPKAKLSLSGPPFV